MNAPAGFGMPAQRVIVALAGEALDLTQLFDSVRSLDGPIGHGTLVAALARLEADHLVESTLSIDRRTVYRLTILGRRSVEAA